MGGASGAEFADEGLKPRGFVGVFVYFGVSQDLILFFWKALINDQSFSDESEVHAGILEKVSESILLGPTVRTRIRD